VKKVFGFMLILFSIVSFANDRIDAKNSGSSAGQSAITKYGSKSKINSNISAPLQGSANLTTVDGTKSFSSKIESCAENNEGIKLTFQPQSNGVLNVQVNQDLNAIGSYDYSTIFSGIENICSGGFKSNNSKHYKYSFNTTNKRISLIEVARSELGGCYCITNTCQFGGYSQSIADKITGDIIGIIGSSGISNYQVGINRYDSSNKTYYLYVKNNTSCRDSNLGNDYTNTNPTSYYSSQSIPPLNLANVAMKDGKKSDSLYYVTSNQNNTVINSINGGANHNISIKNTQVCTVIKKPYLDDNGNIKIEVKDNCIANYSCSLSREEICDSSGRNCIDRILNNTLTSLSIPIQCNIFNSEYQICANGNNISKVSNITGISSNIYSSSNDSYFYIKRHYDCGSQTLQYDASKSNRTFDSVNKTGSTVNYTDFNGTSQNINLGEFENCQIRYCRVKKETIHTQVYTDSTSNSSTKDGVSTVEYEFKKCNQLANSNYFCPTESNEIVLDQCSCNLNMNAAGMAIGFASAVEDAVKDFTCSSN